MKHSQLLAWLSAVLCLTFSISTLWLWQIVSAPKFEASARLAMAQARVARADMARPAPNDQSASVQQAPVDVALPVDEAPPVDESKVLSPEVLSTAALLIADRNVQLSLASPFDSVTDYLLERTRVARPDRGEPGELLITCTALAGDESLQMLSAIVDAYLDAATTAPPALADFTSDERPTVELQTECEQLARAMEQHEQTNAELAAHLQAAKAAAGDPSDPSHLDPIKLEAELVQARRASGDAAGRLADAHRDLERKLPAELIATRIADVPERTKALERLNQLKIKDDLDQQEALRQKWSAIYGKNHPRMAELRQHIESLEQQVSVFSARDQGQPPDVLAASAAAVVLAALESEAAGRAAAERELENRLARVQQQLQQQQELEARLRESRQELEFLHGEHGRLWKEIDGARREQASRLATLVEPPALSPDPVAPQAGLPMAAACTSGMALCLLVIWQFRAQLPRATSRVRAPAQNRAAVRERYRSREEQQLLRLKLQSAR
jgi:hypothetical protein